MGSRNGATSRSRRTRALCHADVHVAFAARAASRWTPFTVPASRPGYRDNGSPGERTVYHPGYYGAFVLDPDGNNVEAVFHDRA